MATKDYFIIGRQPTAWETKAAFGAMKQTVYGFESQTLQNNEDFIDAPYISGRASPQAALEDQEAPEGNIVLHHHLDKMGIFWELFLNGTWTSNDFVAQEVFPTGGFTSGTGFSLTTQPTATSPVSAPGRLAFTMVKTGGFSGGTIVINGTSRGCAITETITTPAEGGSSPVTFTGTKYFDTVDALGIVITQTPTQADTVQIDCDRNIFTNSMTISDTIGNGATIELVREDRDSNLIANTFVGMLANQLNVTFADAVKITTNWMGYQALLRQNLEDDGIDPSDLSGWTTPRITERRFPSRANSLYIDGTLYSTSRDMTINMSKGFAYPDRVNGTRQKSRPMYSQLRDMSITGQIDYKLVANGGLDLAAIKKADQRVDIQILTTYQWVGGPLHTLTQNFNQCQIQQFPDGSVTLGDVPSQPFVFRPLGSEGILTPDEIDIVIESAEDASA